MIHSIKFYYKKGEGGEIQNAGGPCPPSPLPMFLMKHEYRLQKLN